MKRLIGKIDFLKDYKIIKDLFGEDFLIERKEGEEEEEDEVEERNDVFIYKTLKYPPKSKPPTKKE